LVAAAPSGADVAWPLRVTLLSAITRSSHREHSGPERCRRKFVRHFPRGFYDEKYVDWERGYKVEAHDRWNEKLDRAGFRRLLEEEKYSEIADWAVRVESRTNLLFSFEKMALRDAVKSRAGAKTFATGLFEYLYRRVRLERRFEEWVDAVAQLPHPKTRVLTWPTVTVFGQIARPDEHVFLKPNVTRRAASAYGFEFAYESRPNWSTYESLLRFCDVLRRDLRDLRPRDMIDLQSFIWVLGSDEY
jgi:hypothetical protein